MSPVLLLLKECERVPEKAVEGEGEVTRLRDLGRASMLGTSEPWGQRYRGRGGKDEGFG